MLQAVFRQAGARGLIYDFLLLSCGIRLLMLQPCFDRILICLIRSLIYYTVLSRNTATSLAHRGTVSHRRLDFFYSNKNNLVQLEDTTIKTERCCSMQCTERMRAVHHSIDFYLYFKSNIVFGVIIDNQISQQD